MAFLNSLGGLLVLLQVLEGQAVAVVALGVVVLGRHALGEDLGGFLVEVVVEVQVSQGDVGLREAGFASMALRRAASASLGRSRIL